jgi:hypothetical protein
VPEGDHRLNRWIWGCCWMHRAAKQGARAAKRASILAVNAKAVGPTVVLVSWTGMGTSRGRQRKERAERVIFIDHFLCPGHAWHPVIPIAKDVGDRSTGPAQHEASTGEGGGRDTRHDATYR